MARVLIVGGGRRGRRLGADRLAAGDAVRITTRREDGRAGIEALGAECWIGTPDRLETMRGALDRVTIACWLLGTATGDADELAALHGPRLQYWLTQVIDTTVRGVVYEAAGCVPADVLGAGAWLVREHCERNAIPYTIIDADPDDGRWPEQVAGWIDAMVAPPG